jgi:hypothetical protein
MERGIVKVSWNDGKGVGCVVCLDCGVLFYAYQLQYCCTHCC